MRRHTIARMLGHLLFDRRGLGAIASRSPILAAWAGSSRGRPLRVQRVFLEMLDVRLLLSAAISDLGALGQGGNVAGVNVSLDVAGTEYVSGSDDRAFLLDANGVNHNLGILTGGTASFATGLNSDGQVVGYSGSSTTGFGGGGAEAFLYSEGQMTGLGTLGGSSSEAEGINDSGQVVGWANTPSGGQDAFLYSGGKMTDLGGLANSTFSVANAINDQGQLVGYSSVGGQGSLAHHAFLYSGGEMTDLGTLSGNQSAAFGINGAGQVVGEWSDGGTHDDAFLWDKGTMTDLGTLPGATHCAATSINDLGQLVGTASGISSNVGGTTVSHAFLDVNGVMTDLNSLLPANSRWVLNTATDINDNGQIVGMGTYNGEVHGYLLYLSQSPSSLPPSTGGASTVSLQANATASVYGQPVTLTAMVAAASGATGTPTGSVTFFDGMTSLGSVPLQRGIAILPVMALSIGAHSITASYSGDSAFGRSSSAAVTETVGQDKTSVVATSLSDPSDFGQPVTLVASVSPAAPGGGTPTGSVTFYDGSTPLGTATLSGGQATFTASTLTLGSHAITAIYGGDTDFLSATSAAAEQTVASFGFGTVTTLAEKPRSVKFGRSVTLTARVKVAGGAKGRLSGSVTFEEGLSVLGLANLDRGKAHIRLSSLPVGLDPIVVIYGGGGGYAPSTSTTLVETVVAARSKDRRGRRPKVGEHPRMTDLQGAHNLLH